MRAPVLVMGVRGDRVVPAWAVQQTAKAYRVKPLWFDGIGHDLMLDAGWERPLEALLTWIEGSASSTNS
jgi:pimeloyl-ACP methyl ester carboxylesterase